MLSAEPPRRLLTLNWAPLGEISMTERSPRNGCVILSDSDSDAIVLLPVTGIDDVMPMGSLSGIAIGIPVALNVLLKQLATVIVTVATFVAPWLSVAVALIA